MSLTKTLKKKDFLVPNWVWLAGAGYLLLGNKKPKGPPPLLEQKPPKEAEEAAINSLQEQILHAVVSSSWSEPSRKQMRTVSSMLSDPEKYEAAYLLMKGLPESERAAYAKAVGMKAYKLGGGKATPYALGIWSYVHFGGSNTSQLKDAQKEMGVPVTGKADDATVQAVRSLSKREIWSTALDGLRGKTSAPKPESASKSKSSKRRRLRDLWR